MGPGAVHEPACEIDCTRLLSHCMLIITDGMKNYIMLQKSLNSEHKNGDREYGRTLLY